MKFRFMNFEAVKRNLEKHHFWMATSCFNSRCIQSQIWGKVLWLASGEVLMFKYQDFEDDSVFNRKPVKRL